MLDLDHQTGQLANMNLRAEKHGDKNVSGVDLKVSIRVSNDMLSEFHPRLKAAFYREPDPGEMDMVETAEAEGGAPALTRLAFGSKVGAIKWSDEFANVITTVHYGTGGKSDIVLDDTTIDGWVFELMDGGTVQITFRVKCVPDEQQIGKLAGLIGGEIEFSLSQADDGEIE